MQKHVSIPLLKIRKPSFVTQWRAVTSQPFLHQISADLPARGQSKGVCSLSITWPISQNLGRSFVNASVTSSLEHT